MSFESLLSKIERLFRRNQLPYMLVGGFAVAYWGYPRQSLDIDVVIDLDKEKADLFISTAKKLGFLLHPDEVRTVLKLGNRFVMEIDDFRVDCWLPRSAFEKEALKKRRRRKLFDRSLFLISAEDLIISKLLVGRERDHEDIRTIIARQGNKLKLKALRNKALALGVLLSFDKILKKNRRG